MEPLSDSAENPQQELRNGVPNLDQRLLDQFCPECGGIMLYDAPNKRFGCKSCGLYLTRDQLSDIRYKLKTPEDDARRKKSRQQSDYLEWWLSGNKEK